MKKVILLIVFALLIIVLSLIVRFLFDLNRLIALIILTFEILLAIGFTLRFKILSERYFGNSIVITFLLMSLLIVGFFIPMFLYIGPIGGDCTHNFCYKGNISSNLKVDSLEIHLKSIGDILFQYDDFSLKKKVAIKDSINISGRYFCSCTMDIDAVNKIDSFPIILKNDSIKYVMYKKRNEVNVWKENDTIIIDLKKIKIN